MHGKDTISKAEEAATLGEHIATHHKRLISRIHTQLFKIKKKKTITDFFKVGGCSAVIEIVNIS